MADFSEDLTGKRSFLARILIIDDNIDMADSLREALELDDYPVAVAYNGASGITKAREFKPDVLVCDIGLPDMDGYAVARAFRLEEQLAHIYLIALSGYALPDDLMKAKKAGFDKHLAKPINPADLIWLIDQAP